MTSTSYLQFRETSVWSTYRFTADSCHGGSVPRLFTAAQGQVGQGYQTALQHTDTNVKTWGQMPWGQSMEVYGVGWSIFGGSKADCLYLFQHTVWAWDFVLTILDGCPFDTLLLPNTPPDPEVQKHALSHYTGAMHRGYRAYAFPLAIPATAHFAIRLSISAPDQPNYVFDGDTYVRMHLDVTLKTAVQVG